MPPCFDVYVWVSTADRPGVLSRFVERYVDTLAPGEPRFSAFVRTFIACEPAAGDFEALAELRRDDGSREAFSLYLHATTHHQAIVTVTEEGALVLGLGLDDPNNDPATRNRAAVLMASLTEEFGAIGSVAGVELPPPQSVAEWRDDGLVLLRSGSL